MQIKQVKEHNVSWKNTYNSDFKRLGLDGAWKAAEASGYPYICWNGWVYEVALDSVAENNRIVMAEELPV